MSAKNDDAHWALLGEGVIAFCRRLPRRSMPIPPGLHAIPGPTVVLGERFIDSPVGPFISLAIGRPVRLGLRPGYFFGLSVLNNGEARRLGRRYWGFPHELGTLEWGSEGKRRSLIWEERGIELRFGVGRKPMPLLVPIRSLQQRSDGPVVVPSRLRATARRTPVDIHLLDDDPLISLIGRRPGFALSGMLLRRHPARHPLGMFATLRAPLGAAEPGVVGMTGAPVPVEEALVKQVRWPTPSGV